MNRLSISILGLFSLAVSSVFAQQRTDEEAIRAVADNILKQPVTQFVGVKTGVTYNSTKEIPKGEDVKFKSPLTEWHYSNGVLDMSMIDLGKYLNEQKYIDYARNHVGFGFANYKYFKNTFRNDRNHWHWPFGQLWNFKELDDCGAMGAAVIEVYKYDAKPEYKKYIDNAANHVLNGQIRLVDKTLCRTFPREMTVWADDVYMSVSFLAQMGKLTGEAKYFDDAALQIINIADYLWCPEKELFYHCYYTDMKRNGVAFWGRANGWVMVSLVRLLEVLPENHNKRAELLALLEKQIVGVSRYQNANGMWNQLLDKAESYDESSATAMFVYGIAKALNNKWIDPAYERIAQAGWKVLKNTQITEDGRFSNVCVGTGITDDLAFYYNRPVGDNEKHGLGLIIDTGVEMMILNKKK
ncbi:glycosyl hydrolase [Dysgonomonas sp. 216]|uniref:glycoside hydrolase family 88/105 protein n=1 Tax=Dysgonomonas sp. 216 TaxID=2302934 RepID=UPI0013D8862D|nr:glycoside hydrolase family 88 protein [Dysgonomonas sp. 216]NDW19134.1 glycosyl hydrolase [Dysgonomonas sp. 216]